METQHIQIYDTPGQLRILRFVFENGERLSLNYAYMVSVRYAPDSGTIEMVFTSHHITLRGHNLEPLFEDIEIQQTQSIACVGERYKDASSTAEPTVWEIIAVGNLP